VNWLRTAAWTVFALDLVILAQSGYAALTGGGGGPTGQALLRGFTLMLASWLLGVGIVLIVSSWRRSALGLWLSLVFAALPLLWVGSSMLGLWE
jgi:hypothetical protein